MEEMVDTAIMANMKAIALATEVVGIIKGMTKVRVLCLF